jgi:hypothetical protein
MATVTASVGLQKKKEKSQVMSPKGLGHKIN